MPFITEELFQRLPRADLSIPSICVADYPEIESFSWQNESIEKEFEFIQKVARAIRSARSDYNIPNKTKTEAYILCDDEKSNETIKRFQSELQTLSYCSKIEIVKSPPTGCAILTISAQCEVHLMLKGIIEAEKEIAKLQKKRELLQGTVGKLNQLMNSADYATKVPADVQSANQEKLQQSEIEIDRIAAAISALQLL